MKFIWLIHTEHALAETWYKFWGGGRPLQNAKFGGTHCLLELNVGSVLSCMDAVYITIYFTL